MIEYGVDRKITEQSTLAATVAVGIPQGVILRIRLNRATQTYLFPLHLSDEVIMHCIAYFHAFLKYINHIVFTKKKLVNEGFLNAKQNQLDRKIRKYFLLASKFKL